MGIESDQLVFDYLSRVGDLAQQRGLSSGARMRLVAELRAQVDVALDTVPGVRRVLSRLGTPEAVVEAAGGSGPPPSPGPSGAAEPQPRPGLRDKLGGAARLLGTGGAGGTSGTNGGDAPHTPPSPGDQHPTPAKPTGPTLPNLSALGEGLREGLRGRITGKIPAPRDGKRRPGRDREPEPPPTASPPHLAGFDELGDGSAEPDWWRVQEDPYGPYGPGETVPGFVGGIEIPEIRERPPGERADGPLSLEKGERDGDDDAEDAAEEDDEAGGEYGEEAAEAPRGVLPRVLARWRRSGAAPEPYAEEPEAVEYAPVARAPLSPVLLLAGAPAGGGRGDRGLARARRRLGDRVHLAAAAPPRGEVRGAGGAGSDRRRAGGVAVGPGRWWWGDPIAEGQLGHELTGVLPVVVRVAAVASAVFLVWRMRRQPR
ncbi:Integral membrane protein OS=Streptomyces rimosus subsp. rimosus (strain ATCC / DSM 40260 /JCM 4667 / NRRL 2234) OX=1265868 GN=SRIM_024640 PE=4 SV=1 [Streptomyces rimosus subsp. rimosus]